MAIDPAILTELCSPEHFVTGKTAVFREQSRAIDPASQAAATLLIHRLRRQTIDPLEAEILTLALVRRSLGEAVTKPARATYARRKLAERAKLILLQDVTRRWTLTEIAGGVGVTAVYLAQVFSQVEQIPLYRYHLQLRLARALDMLPGCRDLTDLGLSLGFSSHSHFTSAFKQHYGQSPAQFRHAIGAR